MSVSYYVYTEIQINGKWIAVNALVPSFKWDSQNNKYLDQYTYKLGETYYNGSRSYFREANDKLEQIGQAIKYSDCSNAVKEIWKSSVEAEERGDAWSVPIAVSFSDFERYVDVNKFDRHGIIHKDQIFDWENCDADDLYPVDPDEYFKMTDEEKKQYQYYEWDDPFGYNRVFKEIYKNAVREIESFKEQNFMIGAEALPTRLIIIQC